MKKLMLPIIAFVVMFAAGAGGGAVAFKPKPAPADSAHAAAKADSVTGDSAGHGAASTVAHETVPPDSATLANDPHAADPARGAAAHGAAPGATPASTDPNKVTIGKLVQAQAGATVSLRPDGSIGPDVGNAAPRTAPKAAQGPDFDRMARLLAKMGPREAARTIEQLAPDDAARALAQMNDKQAAAVLQQLAPDKAASLLQSAITLIPKAVAP